MSQDTETSEIPVLKVTRTPMGLEATLIRSGKKPQHFLFPGTLYPLQVMALVATLYGIDPREKQLNEITSDFHAKKLDGPE